jgi:hypothetical protein
MRPSRLALAAIVTAIVAASCGGDDSGGSAPPANELTYTLQTWTTELGPDVLAAITAKDDGDGTLRFRGAPDAVHARQPGDVILAGHSPTTPYGFIRAVVSVADDGGDTVVETIPVPLPFAFKNLHAKLRRAPVDVANPSATTGTRNKAGELVPRYSASKVVGGARVFDTVLFNQDENLDTKDDQFVVHAELSGQVGYSASVDLDWLDDANVLSSAKKCLEKVVKNPFAAFEDCIPVPDVKIGFDASLRGDSVLDVDGASAQSYESPALYLNEEPWELDPLYAGPVVLVPELDFTARVGGDASTYFHARTEFGYEVGVSASAGVKSGVTPPKPTFTKKYDKPIVSVSSTGHSKASFGPRLSLLAYDSFGFYADLHGYGNLDADLGRTPCWDYEIGVELEPGVRLRIPWKRFGLGKLAAKLGWDRDVVAGKFGTINLYNEHPFDGLPVEQRACDKPPVSALPLGEGPTNETYQTPTFTPWSFRYGDVAARQPYVATPGEVRAIVEKGHDSSWIVSGAYVGGVLDLSDGGDVRWARQIALGRLPDEEALALDKNASSVLALASTDATIFAASDRLTLLSLGYDGALLWAKRLRIPTGLPDEEMRAVSPVAMSRMPNGDFAILWSRRTVEGAAHELLLLRARSDGSVRFAKRFHFPTGDTSVGATLVPFDDDIVVGGYSFAPAETASYLMRFDPAGAVKWEKRLGACGSTRVRVEAATRRASGDLALAATYEISPERNVFATLSPDGDVRGAVGTWSGSIVQDLTAVTLAELPTSGFVTMEQWTPYVGNRLELSTRDSLGNRTGGVGYGHMNQALTALTSVRPAGLRLTTDGGALVVAHVTQDKALNDDGLWISKLPARTFEAPFDSTLVQTVVSAWPAQACTATTAPATIDVGDLALDDIDVTSIAGAVPLTPVRDARAK